MSLDSAAIDLTHHFLIAMPGLEDALFEHSVVYVCEHNERGALGLIINKPSDLLLSGLFEKIALTLNRTDLSDAPVFLGGPVQTERGFVLHEPMGQGGESVYSSTLVIKGESSETAPEQDPIDESESESEPDGEVNASPARLEMTTSKDVLEAMAEGRVSVDGVTHDLEQPFLVIATQNPVDHEGTFPLPEAQLDRFLMKFSLGYPTLEDELKMLELLQRKHPIDSLQPVASAADLIDAEHVQRPGGGVADGQHTVIGQALYHLFGRHPADDDTDRRNPDLRVADHRDHRHGP